MAFRSIAALFCAFASTLFATAVGATANNDDAVLQALRTTAANAYATLHAIEHSRVDASANLAAVDERVRELRGEIDALRQLGHVSDFDDSTPLARKLHSVAMLVANVERARADTNGAAMNRLAQHRPSAQRRTFGALDASHGGSCEGAIGVSFGTELDGPLAAGGEVWLRVAASSEHAIRIDTSVFPMDTEIAVFDSCAQTSESPRRLVDDSFGLAAAVTLPVNTAAATQWLRVRNLGPSGEFGVTAGVGGSIRGHVSDSTSPVLFANVIALDSSGNYVGGDNSGGGGYDISVDAGNYYVVASYNDHVTQIWPNVECPSYFYYYCPLTSAQRVTVVAGAATSGIDFVLDAGARITGRVHDAVSGLAVPHATLTATNAQNQLFGTIYADDAGRYAATTLSAGTYRLVADAPMHIEQLFDGIDCPIQVGLCPMSSGTPIPLARHQSRDNVNFNLHAAPYVNVTVNQAPGSSVSGSIVTAFGATGSVLASSYAAFGQVTPIGPLPPGTYRFVASAQNHVSQLYDHIDCVSSDCAGQLANGTPVQVAADMPPPSATFDLHALARVSGRVTDSVSGDGLQYVGVNLVSTSQSGWVYGIDTLADGSFRIEGVAAGTYWVVARSQDHRDTVFPGAPCTEDYNGGVAGCQLTSAQPVTVGASDIVGIDFALPLNATITGNVRLHAANPPLMPGYADVVAYNASGGVVGSASTDFEGNYRLQDLTTGTYYFEAQNYAIYSQIYAGIDCPQAGTTCDATVGTPVSLVAGQTQAGIDFDVLLARRIVGRVTDSASGSGIAGVAIDSWDAQTGEHCEGVPTDSDGYYVLDASSVCFSDARKLSSDAGPYFVDEVYDDLSCPNGPAYLGLCSIEGGTMVPFATGQVALNRVDFALSPRVTIFANGFEAPVTLAERRPDIQ
jgi:protocatechuate 3,4-dioxygenase beta subunit